MSDAPSRKLAVILHADVVSSTALVRLNEGLAHQRIQDAFRRFSETITAHDGITHEIRGDALVAEFARASDAISAAVAFQSANAVHNEKLPDDIRPAVRIGISMGEVVIADNTVTGEGVVLAQRLEQIAETGGVCIQDAAYQTVPKRLPFTYENLGERQLKGFDEPVRAFRVVLPGDKIQSGASAEDTSSSASSSAASESRTSLAVLPFNVIGGNPETEVLADGLTDVVINTISRTGIVKIADRASAFSYKGQSPRPVDVATALSVHHVLQGSVQQSGARIRITAELFDADANRHVWSERFDRTIEDVFELQDDIAKRITVSIRTGIFFGTDWDVPTASFDAWVLNLQAIPLIYAGSAKTNREARNLYEQVIEHDPSYPYGPGMLGYTHRLDCIYAWSRSPESSLQKSVESMEQLFCIDTIEAFPYRCMFGAINLPLQGSHDRAIEMGEKHLELAPDDGGSMLDIGWIHCLSGEPTRAQRLLSRSVELLSKPWCGHFEWLGLSHLLCGDQNKALSALARACTLAEDPTFPHALKAVAYVELDKPQSASAEMRSALELRPELTLKHFHYYLSFRDPAQRERFSRTLLQAGLPE